MDSSYLDVVDVIVYLSASSAGHNTLLDHIKADETVKVVMLQKSESRPDQTNLERLMLSGANWADLYDILKKSGNAHAAFTPIGLTAEASLQLVRMLLEAEREGSASLFFVSVMLIL